MIFAFRVRVTYILYWHHALSRNHVMILDNTITSFINSVWYSGSIDSCQVSILCWKLWNMHVVVVVSGINTWHITSSRIHYISEPLILRGGYTYPLQHLPVKSFVLLLEKLKKRCIKISRSEYRQKRAVWSFLLHPNHLFASFGCTNKSKKKRWVY